MVVPEARRDPVLGRFALKRLKLPVKGGRLDIVCPERADDILNAMTEEEFAGHETFPYWAEVWTSAVALARELRKGPPLFGRRVLDLGCGVGVAGVAAATMGAAVCFADFFPEAVAFALFNARHNSLAPGLEGSGSRPEPSGTRLDWTRDRPESAFDLVLGADILYEERHHAPVLDLLKACLVPGGRALLADPGRIPARGVRDLLAAEGKVVHRRLETFWPDRRMGIDLYEFEAEAPDP